MKNSYKLAIRKFADSAIAMCYSFKNIALLLDKITKVLIL